MDQKYKYLEFIQGVITRMNSNSFIIKGWVVTLLTGIYAVAISSEEKQIFYLSFLVLVMFWLLDSYYLYQERLYRELYDNVRKREDEFDFNLNAYKFKTKRNSMMSSFFSIALLVFYLPLVIISIGILFIIQ